MVKDAERLSSAMARSILSASGAITVCSALIPCGSLNPFSGPVNRSSSGAELEATGAMCRLRLDNGNIVNQVG